MIRGHVTEQREALINVEILGADDNREVVEAVIDTGFNDFLALPPSLVERLKLAFAAPLLATLADGDVVEMSSYRATILWDDQKREILVLACEGGALVGMSLLFGHDVHIEAVDGGAVTIQKHE